MRIAYVLNPHFTALRPGLVMRDHQPLAGGAVHFLATSLEPVRCDAGLTVVPTDTPTRFPTPS